MSANKVKFNLKNVHYAKRTAGTSGATYATPVAIPGAVSISLDANGDISKFYADGVVYYQTANNNGYEGDLEIALIPEAFRKDILMEDADSNGVLFENTDVEPASFALGFQIDGDVNEELYWFYNCVATRPNAEGSTNEDSKDPTTDKLTISCTGDDDGNVRAKTGSETSETVRNAWFNEVYTKATA